MLVIHIDTPVHGGLQQLETKGPIKQHNKVAGRGTTHRPGRANQPAPRLAQRRIMTLVETFAFAGPSHPNKGRKYYKWGLYNVHDFNFFVSVLSQM